MSPLLGVESRQEIQTCKPGGLVSCPGGIGTSFIKSFIFLLKIDLTVLLCRGKLSTRWLLFFPEARLCATCTPVKFASVSEHVRSRANLVAANSVQITLQGVSHPGGHFDRIQRTRRGVWAPTRRKVQWRAMPAITGS